MGMNFGMGLAGMAQQAVDTANKYIDMDIANQRAQVLADIQRRSTVQTDDELARARLARAPQEDAAAAARAVTVGKATNQVSLEGAQQQASDPTITQGLAGRESAIGKARTGVEVDRAGQLAQVNLDAQKKAFKELTGLKAAEAGAVEDARQASIEKHRKYDPTKQTPDEKLAQIQIALGRQLKPEEREALLGLTKAQKDDPIQKLAYEVATKGVESGAIKPEEVASTVQKIVGTFESSRLIAQMTPVIAKARANKDVATLVERMRAEGFTDSQLMGFGMTKDEISPKKPTAQKPQVSTTEQDMAGITFSGDGYTYKGKTYPTPSAARAARDADNKNPSLMHRAMETYGD